MVRNSLFVRWIVFICSEPTAVAGQTLTLTAAGATDANTWVASFTNLPQFENGQEIVYSVKEVNVPEGYEASVSGQVVTNSYDPETIVISGTKVWDDNENQDGKRTDRDRKSVV